MTAFIKLRDGNEPSPTKANGAIATTDNDARVLFVYGRWPLNQHLVEPWKKKQVLATWLWHIAFYVRLRIQQV